MLLQKINSNNIKEEIPKLVDIATMEDITGMMEASTLIFRLKKQLLDQTT